MSAVLNRQICSKPGCLIHKLRLCISLSRAGVSLLLRPLLPPCPCSLILPLTLPLPSSHPPIPLLHLVLPLLPQFPNHSLHPHISFPLPRKPKRPSHRRRNKKANRGRLTAKASGLTPFSIRLTHIERDFRSSWTFYIPMGIHVSKPSSLYPLSSYSPLFSYPPFPFPLSPLSLIPSSISPFSLIPLSLIPSSLIPLLPPPLSPTPLP